MVAALAIPDPDSVKNKWQDNSHAQNALKLWHEDVTLVSSSAGINTGIVSGVGRGFLGSCIVLESEASKVETVYGLGSIVHLEAFAYIPAIAVAGGRNVSWKTLRDGFHDLAVSLTGVDRLSGKAVYNRPWEGYFDHCIGMVLDSGIVWLREYSLWNEMLAQLILARDQVYERTGYEVWPQLRVQKLTAFAKIQMPLETVALAKFAAVL
jgi:hypothetical protein